MTTSALTRSQQAAIRQKRWRQKNRAAHAAYNKKWRLKNPEAAKAIEARQRASGRPRERKLIAKFGLTLEDRDAILLGQGRACAVCRSPSPRSKHDWSVDHDHRTGRVRGILCHHCNLALGHVGDDVTILRKLIEYLGGNDVDV